MPDGRLVTPDIRYAERLQGFVPGWTLPVEALKKAGFRWKLVGNAVSVDAAAWIGWRLREPGGYDDQDDRPLTPKGTSWPTSAYNVDGRRMMSGHLSEWPRDAGRTPLADFLRFEGKRLSVRAATGFHGRAIHANLSFAPGFLSLVQAHFEGGSGT